MDFKQKFIKFLCWSQKYTETDMVYLTVGGFWLILGQFIYSASAFILSLVFANLLPKETYGAYKYILSFASILSIFTFSEINTSVTQAVARGYKGSFTSALKTRLYCGILGGIIGLFISGYYLLLNNTTMASCFLIAAVFAPIMNSFNIYESLLDGEKKFNVRTKYRIFLQLFTASILIATLFITRNIIWVLFAYFIPQTVLCIIFHKISVKKIRLNDKKDPNTISYGKHLSFMGMLSSVAKYSDRIIIWHFLGPVSVAVYSIALALPQQIGGLFKNIGLLALPKFSCHTTQDLKKTIFPKVFKLFIAAVLLTGLYLVFSPFLFKLFFPNYLDSLAYSQVFSLSFVTLAGGQLLSTALLAQKRNRELYVVRLVPPAIKIALFLILIPSIGIWGAIYAILITEVIKLFLYLVLFKKA